LESLNYVSGNLREIMKFKTSIHPFVFSLIIVVFTQIVLGQNENNFGSAVLYSGENYNGASHRLRPGDQIESLELLDKNKWPSRSPMIGSIEILGNVSLELWPQNNFQGNSVQLSKSYSSLERFLPSQQIWKAGIASLKVVSSQTPKSRTQNRLQPSPQIQKPQLTGEVRVYQDAGFNGDSLTFDRPQSEQNLNYINRSNSRWNDGISSIYIKGSYSVVLYQDANFKGDSIRIDESVSNLRDLRRRDPAKRNWNDAISSFEILGKNEESRYSNRGQRYAGTIYEDDNFQGRYQTLFDGQMIRNLRDLRWNDAISSIMVEKGYKIVLYQNSNFSGESITLDLHQPSLQSFSGRWNDQASSLKVIKD